MKKIIFSLSIMAILAGVFYSCEKEDSANKEQQSVLFENNKYNHDLRDLSKILSVALEENDEFRKMVKKEALKQFDGDYDILLKNFKDMEISDPKEKGSSISIGSFLGNYHSSMFSDEEMSSTKSSAQEYLDSLTILYPDLQISVPRHAEDWEEGYTPIVSFVPDEVNKETLELPGFKNNVLLSVDAQTSPEDAVVVVGMNERGGIKWPGEGDPPIVTIALQVNPINQGAHLQWTISNVSGGDINAYRIYRKKAGEQGYSPMGYSPGYGNLSYDDIGLESLETYTYYVVAVNFPDAYSVASNHVSITTPDYPQGVGSFDIFQYTTDEAELHWTYEQNQYFTQGKIGRKIIGVNSNYPTVFTFTHNDHLYMDDVSQYQGKKIVYQNQLFTNGNGANPKYDFIQIPYRNISTQTPVFIEEMRYNYDFRDDIEEWYYGKPELRVTVVKAVSETNAVTVQPNIQLIYQTDHSYQSFDQKNVCNWLPTEWTEILTFKMVEWDWAPDVDLTLSAKLTPKVETDIGNFQLGEVGVTINNIFEEEDTDVGYSWLKYTDPEETWILFPNFGAKLRISTVDNISQ